MKRSARLVLLVLLIGWGAFTGPWMIGAQPPPAREYTPPADGFTNITIDGDPSDWAAYPAIYADPVEDSTGNVDLTYIYAFTNDTYLYLLFEVAGEIGPYVQLDVLINWERPMDDDYMINARPYENPHPHVSRIVNGQGGRQGNVAQGVAFEMRIPRGAFMGPPPRRVEVRVMDGICCGPQWVVVDGTEPATILQTEEKEPPLVSLADLTASDSVFCRDGALAEGGVFEPTADIEVSAQYQAEFFVAPSGLNYPADVVALPDGGIIVTGRDGKLHRVALDGTISEYARARVNAIDLDGSGQLYGYDSPGGGIYHITPGQGGKLIASVPQTCHGVMATAPSGTLYIASNHCCSDGAGCYAIYKVPAGGGTAIEWITGLEGLRALDLISEDRLYVLISGTLQVIDTATGETTQVVQLPEWGTGLAVAPDGTAYASAGDTLTSSNLYRITPEGEVSLLVALEGDGLGPLAITPEGEIVATQPLTNGLVAITLDGVVRTVIEPNGLVSPQALAFSPCGELVVVADEAGGLILVTPDGETRLLVRLASYTPPLTFIAFAPQGWYVAGESAPGFPSLLNRYLPNGAGLRETLADDIPQVSGVAVGTDGSIYASSTIPEGKIFHLFPDGTRQVLIDGLQTPQALTLNSDGILYAVVGGEGGTGLYAAPLRGDTILSIGPDGTASTLANVRHATDMALGPDGLLYVAAGQHVYRVWPFGIAELFASGFSNAQGVAFDVEGNLYVADEGRSAIVRINGFPQGRLTGVVTNAVTGTPLEGVRLRVVQARPPFTGRMVVTAADGTFSLEAAPDTYNLTAWAEGYRTTVWEGITVGDEPMQLTLALPPAE